MKAPGHYDAGPPVKTRFTTFAADRFDLEICPRLITAAFATVPCCAFGSSDRSW
jgi:hypothetical protein